MIEFPGPMEAEYKTLTAARHHQGFFFCRIACTCVPSLGYVTQQLRRVADRLPYAQLVEFGQFNVAPGVSMPLRPRSTDRRNPPHDDRIHNGTSTEG